MLIATAMNAYAASSGRVLADRASTVGASEVGQCARKVYWLKNEDDPQHAAARDPDYQDGWGARMRGSIYENHFWEPALRQAYGKLLLFAGSEQQTFASGFLSATPDGLIVGGGPDGEDCMVECKTADPRTNLSEAKAENVYQTHVQMGLIRELTPWKPTHSILSYTDASFWNEVKEFVIPFDQRIFETAKRRAAEIITAKHASDLKPEGWIAGGRECDYCPFTRACGIERRKGPSVEGVPDPQFVAEMAGLAKAIKACEAAAKGNDTRLRELQDEMRNRLRQKGVRKIPGVVTWSAVKGRSGWDNKAIREAAEQAGIDLSPFNTVGEPTDRLMVTISASTDVEEPQAANEAA